MKFSTRAIHAGQPPDPATGAIMTPVYYSSTFVQEAPGKHKGYDYSRSANPTRSALEANLASLEEGKVGLAFSSGCGAATTFLGLLKSGDHVVCGNDVYGGTYRLFTRVFQQLGIETTFVDTTQLENIRSGLRKNTRLVWLETPSNPLLRITDLAGASEIARKSNVLCLVDNTFATPYLQQPLRLGAHVVLHSTTKYLGGHSDIVGGALVTSEPELGERLRFLQNAMGATPSPMDSWLVLRGIKTLAVRMEKHCDNADALSRMLAAHPLVERMHYPGLPKHGGHALAARQMKRFGGMISFEVRGTIERAVAFVRRTKIFSLAESLGGVESLIEHPASMTHASIPREERLKFGLPDGLVRLSVGIEDVEDLEEDLRQALDSV